jgi:hypothetical protein
VDALDNSVGEGTGDCGEIVVDKAELAVSVVVMLDEADAAVAVVNVVSDGDDDMMTIVFLDDQ